MISRLKPSVFTTLLRWNQNARATLDAAGAPPLSVSAPPEYGGEGGRWSPEELLVGAVEACTMLTFLDAARRRQVELVSYSSQARGTLAAAEDGARRFTAITIEPRIEVASADDAEKAREILARLPGRCFVGASLKSEPQIDATVLAVGR
jgi:organic hydroperoxide reductase OsmC/OhrA